MAHGERRGGIDLGGTKIQAVVVDGEHQVLGKARRPTPTTGGPHDVVRELAGALSDAAAEAGVPTAALAGVGVGSPGDIDVQAGTVGNAGNLPGFAAPFPVASALGEALGTRVVLGNDVQVATDAEFALGAGRDRASVLGVFWGTGVGGGLVLGGRPWTGRGAAGEIGHVVVRPGGEPCGCGRRGCMEAYAGRRSMERRAREAVAGGAATLLFSLMEARGRERLTSGVWAKALASGDVLAAQLLTDAVEALGIGVASACNVLDPEAVVVGGGLGVRLGEPFVARIRDAMLPHLFTSDRPPLVAVAELGDLGGALGAALLVT